MFLTRRPSPEDIERYLRESRDLPLSYAPVGILSAPARRGRIDELTRAIGRGKADFERARDALIAWKQFEIGWVETFPRPAPVAVGTEVAVLIRHLGFWSLNGCRIVQVFGDASGDRFGFAYGTLINHAEQGEEIFEVYRDPESDDVLYRIRAVSRPRAALAYAGYPITRALQARFRCQSAEVMRRAANGLGAFI